QASARGLRRVERVVAACGSAGKNLRHRQSHSSMDLLLTHGYFLYEDPKELQIMKPYAPLGILYLSSHLRAKHFGVEVYDSTFGSRQELFRILADGPPAEKLLARAEGGIVDLDAEMFGPQ